MKRILIAAGILLSVIACAPKNQAAPVNPADASGPFESYDYGKESYFIYQSGNADSFNKGYYENGTGVPPFEKVAI